jgi:alpha-L-arabinofuranosidase
MGVTIQRALQKDLGHKLTLYPMEENGSRCDWDRGLAHAHNWNTLQRYADCFEWLGTANTIQPHRQHYMWDQGRVHYTSDEIWFQPSAHEDEMMSKNWLFNVLETSSSQEKVLDITAKTNDKKSELSIYVVNVTDQPQEAVINVDGYKYASTASVWTIGGCELTDYNTVEQKDKVAPKTSTMKMKRKNTKYTFPKYSYTVITLKR